ncbi:hypothetical protein HHH56_02580 [Flammeovirga yaeyamensis]|nr:hypothetical protein [Flammeovirga yaeyamensis]
MITRKKNELYEIKHENGKFFLYKNKQHIKTFHNELIAMGYVKNLH